jgi:nucleotide-binding universal stress UspA family protein
LIVAQAKAMQALVVVAATRKHLFPWWLRTHVAEYVVRQAEVPVLIVPRYGDVIPPAKVNHVDNHSN